MGAVFGIVATVVALLGLLVALGNLGYLAMLNKAAIQRGAAGAPVGEHVKSRLPATGATAAAAAVGLMLTAGGPLPDVLGMLLGSGAGLVAKQSLDATRARFRSQP